MRRALQAVGPLVTLAVFAAAIWFLNKELAKYRLSDVLASLAEIPASHVALAIVLTFVNYGVLVGYDLLALRVMGHRLPLRRIVLASFVGYAATNNLGTLLGGSAVRYRLYSAWGLSTLDIVRLVAILLVVFWVGAFAVAGTAFVLDPLPIPSSIKLPVTTVRPLGFVLLTVVAVYFGACAWGKARFSFRGLEVSFPPLRYGLPQVMVAAADLLLAAGVLYLLLPAEIELRYAHFVTIYLLAMLAGVLTQVPGGLGVFEVCILWLVPDPTHKVFGSLLAFRGIYYLLPLVLAGVALASHELFLRRETVRRVAGVASRVAPAVVPRVFAVLVFVSGIILIASGATHMDGTRVAWMRNFVPLPVVEASHFLGSVVGAALLILAWGLYRRLDSAYWMSLGLLAAGAVFSLLKGFDYEEAAVLAVMLAALAPAHRHFHRRGSLVNQPFTAGWIVALAAVLVAATWLVLFSYRHVEYSDQLWWTFSMRGDAPRSMRAGVGAVGLILVFGLSRLLQPARPKPAPPSDDDMAAARKVVAASTSTDANLALLGDKFVLFNDDRTAFIMYGVQGRSWISMGDPVGPVEAWDDLIWSFRELCDEFHGRPVFYQVSGDELPVYVDHGFSLLKLGEMGRTHLTSFTLEGPEHRGLRQSYNKLSKKDLSFEVLPVEQVGAIVHELRRISDAWLAQKNTREKGFSLGYFDEAYVRQFPVAFVRQGGAIVAFANLWLSAQKEELSIDLMRYVNDAPNGVMESLFVALMVWGKEQGFHWFSLGMAPLAGLENRPMAPLWNRLGAVLYRHGEHFYNFQGLRSYKEKFDPVWSPRYLASTGSLGLPAILTDVAALIAGGLGGILRK